MPEPARLYVKGSHFTCYKCGRRWKFELPMKINKLVQLLHRTENQHTGRCRPKKET